jgi:hypothetical protein
MADFHLLRKQLQEPLQIPVWTQTIVYAAIQIEIISQ